MPIERRKYVRFLAEPNSYAAIGASFTKVGKIRDISMGGLAFEYIFTEQISKLPDSKVTIFLTENNYHLPNIPCRVVRNFPKDNADQTPSISSNLVTKQCALKFTSITESQRQSLEYFMNHHTRGIAPSTFSPNQALENQA